jgi:aspartate racemase
MINGMNNRTLGIVGGVGPVASAEFLNTIYENLEGGLEQELPRVVMWSDPTFPDRTEAFLAGQSEFMLKKLMGVVGGLADLGASRIVICCVTMHYLLPRLPPEMREKIVSLIDVIFESLLANPRRCLLLCSNGTRRLELFENHRLWGRSQRLVALPDWRDQQTVHEIIYRVKKNHAAAELIRLLEPFGARYKVDALIAGCTEFHVLARRSREGVGKDGLRFLDPLTIIAEKLARDFV